MIDTTRVKKSILAILTAFLLLFSILIGSSFGAVVAPSSLAFSTTQNVGVAATKTVTVTNNGPSFETLPAATITGTNVGDFTITNDTCSNVTLQAGDACTLDVVFKPPVLGSRKATLTATAASSTALTGTAISTINGTVTDFSTRLPLANVTVTATLPGGTSPLTAITKADGSFSLANSIAYGVYDVTLTKIGYSGYSINIGSISATQGSTLKLAMAPQVAMNLLNIVSSSPLVPVGTFTDAIKITGGVGPYSFNLVSHTAVPPTLPPGLVLDSATGMITGIPTAAGTYGFTIGVSDGLTGYAERAFTLNIPVITTASFLPRATQGAVYTATLTAQSPTPVTFGCTPPGSVTPACSTVLPAGLSLSATTGTSGTGFTASLTGTPTTVGSYSFDLYAIESGGRSYKKTVRMYVEAPLAFTSSSLAKGAVNAPYSQSLVASGGFPPYTWSVASGTLPVGLTLDAATGKISGTPTQVESQTITLTLDDYLGRNVTISKTFTLEVGPQLALTTTSLNRGMVGVAYAASLATSGGIAPYNYLLATGSVLPAGLTLNKLTGAISGTPTVAGAFSFTITVTDAVSSFSSQTIPLVIDTALSITSVSPLAGLVNTAYSTTLTATGGIHVNQPSYLWGLTKGVLPNGISLDSSTGVLSGTATNVSSTSITLMATDDYGRTATKVFTLDFANPLALVPSIIRGTQNVTYAGQLTATGGTTPYKYALTSGTLPAGLALSTTGLISGKPTTAGASVCSFTVTDAAGRTDTQSITINIDAPLTVATTLLTDGATGAAYSQTLAAAGGYQPYTWSITTGSLPAGLTLNATSGLISGTPTGAVRPSFTVTVTDANSRTASKDLVIAVPLALVAPLPGTGAVGNAYSATATASGGVSPYHYSLAGTPPAGVAINTATGAISGIPTQSGTFNFAVTVVDANGRSVTSTTTAVTISPAFYISTATLHTVIANSPYSQVLTVSGGVAPYTWSISAGSLTTGLTLGTASGSIYGTPTTDITQSVTIRVVDTNGLQATKQFIPPLTLHTVSMPNGTLGSGYSEYVVVSGGLPPYTFALTGQLPAGLTLDTATGLISGTPTEAVYTNAGVTIVDSSTPDRQTMSFTFGIRVWSAPSIVYPSNSLTAENAVSIAPVTMVAKGGTAPYSWQVLSGTLPPGLELSNSGVISGTPTKPGDYSPTILVHDSSATPVAAQKIFYIHVEDTKPATVTLSGLNQLYDGTPKNVIVETNPAGLAVTVTYDGSSTAPTAAGCYQVIATINDQIYRGSATDTLNITLPGAAPTLSVAVQGNGSGDVNSDPGGIVCASGNVGVCSKEFSQATVTLFATPSPLSVFEAWEGCAATGGDDAKSCVATMDISRTVTATFKLAPKAMIGEQPYDSLAAAYGKAASGATILLLDAELEGLSIRDKDLVLKGGYKTDFKDRSGSPTVLNGGVSLVSGNSTVETIDVKGAVVIQGGSLLVNGVTIR